jgi:hypothetical protein
MMGRAGLAVTGQKKKGGVSFRSSALEPHHTLRAGRAQRAHPVFTWFG